MVMNGHETSVDEQQKKSVLINLIHFLSIFGFGLTDFTTACGKSQDSRESPSCTSFQCFSDPLPLIV